MQLTTLAKFPHYYQQTVRLIENAFKYPSGQSFTIDFYPLMRQENWKHCHILIEDEKVVAHVGVLLKTLTINTPVAFLGGIAVDHELQGKGIFRQIFEATLSQYQNKIAFFVLWSDLASLYKKFDFYQAGQCNQTGDSIFTPPSNYQQCTLSSLSCNDIERLHHLYNSDPSTSYVTIKRDHSDWTILGHISSASLYVKRDAKNRIDAYFFVGKGADLTDIIHENASSKESKPNHLNALAPYRLWLSSDYPSPTKSLFLGLFRMGSSHLFKKFIEIYLDDQLKILKLSPHQITFIHDHSKYSISVEEFLPLLFGPNKANEFAQIAKPLYFSGLDTI